MAILVVFSYTFKANIPKCIWSHFYRMYVQLFFFNFSNTSFLKIKSLKSNVQLSSITVPTFLCEFDSIIAELNSPQSMDCNYSFNVTVLQLLKWRHDHCICNHNFSNIFASWTSIKIKGLQQDFTVARYYKITTNVILIFNFAFCTGGHVYHLKW